MRDVFRRQLLTVDMPLDALLEIEGPQVGVVLADLPALGKDALVLAVARVKRAEAPVKSGTRSCTSEPWNRRKDSSRNNH